jgi:hypothetical protein
MRLVHALDQRDALAGERRHLPRPRQTALARPDHAQELEDVGFVGAVLDDDVVAEPLGLLVGVGVTVDVGEQARVISRHTVALNHADAVGDPQRDNRLAQAVLHRLAAAKVSGQGQRRHELCEPYAPPIHDCRHRPSLDLPTSRRLARK